ncbi:MAG: hypothetical protein ACREF4_09795, partial [Gammaproteobacteria bacterium]
LGAISARELSQLERGRVEEIVKELLSARSGEYRVRERQLAPGTPDLKIDPRPLILKGILEAGDRSLVMDEIGSLDTVYVVKRPALEDSGLSVPGEFHSILRLVDGKRSIAQICAVASLPDYFVCSAFAALSVVGAVRRNYARSQGRSRGEIVKGAEVTGATIPHDPAPPETPDSLLSQEAEVARPAPTPAPPALLVEERKSLPEAAASSPIATPPITTTPFPGEGPTTAIQEASETEEDRQESRRPLTDAEPARPEPPRPALRQASEAPVRDARAAMRLPIEPVRGAPRRQEDRFEGMPKSPPPPAAPAYGGFGGQESSRPWFLLGGAAAVGLLALLLALTARRPEVEVIESDFASPDPAELAVQGAAAEDLPTTAASEDRDDAEIAAPARQTPLPNAPATAPMEAVARPPAPPILPPEAPRADTGRRSLLAGDYRSAARQFGSQTAGLPGAYTIQLLMACQDETVKRAVDRANGSSQLFILPATHEGRTCYRVYWGRYQTQGRAQDALRRDLPSSFRLDRPRVTRLAGS